MTINRKNFIARNDSFVCEWCEKSVAPAKGTFRNHCPYCLTSKHVDETVPGDRLATCGGLMPSISYDGVDPNKLDLVQRCVRCKKIRRNRRADDDDFNKILYLRQLG